MDLSAHDGVVGVGVEHAMIVELLFVAVLVDSICTLTLTLTQQTNTVKSQDEGKCRDTYLEHSKCHRLRALLHHHLNVDVHTATTTCVHHTAKRTNTKQIHSQPQCRCTSIRVAMKAR